MTIGFWAAFAPVLAAAVLGGALAGGLGLFVVAMRIALLALLTAHAALAGAVLGQLFGFPPGFAGTAGALAGSLLLGLCLRQRDIDPGAVLGTLFSLMLGLAFLGIGLMRGARSEALSILWGSLLFVRPSHLWIMAGIAIAFAAFVLVFEQELKLLLFNRELASLHMPEWLLFTAFLALAGLVIAVNLEVVGGLFLYSLVCNPAIAALRVARSWRGAIALSVSLGAASALAGFFAAYQWNLPVGACIVIASSAPVGIAFLRRIRAS
ncbi:MAG: metal ABC transporter permease [Vicinamibacteria bacterium]|nr:metal ABC transporter permease [Vicinamibacteria bacterium]